MPRAKATIDTELAEHTAKADWTTTRRDLHIEIDGNGYAIVHAALASEEIDALRGRLRAVTEIERRRGGVRSILRDVPAIRELAEHPAVRDAAAAVAGDECFPVRAIYFDKTRESNWNVRWHQDLTIAVRERREVTGFGPWTFKDGVPHVQPPVEVLERMVAVRLHLDVCGSENGPVRVIPGSHKAGRLSEAAIEDWRTRSSEVVCEAPAGGLLIMRPLILHASSKATVPTHRRVIHIEYASRSLPCGLNWFEQATGPV
jgi:hypothetical protein